MLLLESPPSQLLPFSARCAGVATNGTFNCCSWPMVAGARCTRQRWARRWGDIQSQGQNRTICLLQELVADDNAEQAALFLPLAGASCLYKFNRPDYWFQCLLLGLEWHRAQQEFRFAAAAAGLPPMLLSGCLVGSSGTARSRCTEAELAFPFVSRRLYFEARGETDLRHPSASSVGYTVHRGGGGGADDRRRLQERLQQLQARCGLL